MSSTLPQLHTDRCPHLPGTPTTFLGHPAWATGPGCAASRVLRTTPHPTLVTLRPTGQLAVTPHDADTPHPLITTATTGRGEPNPTPLPLRRVFDPLGVVAWYRNPSLWDAIAAAIIRDAHRTKAPTIYQALCRTAGRRVASADRCHPHRLFPTPEVFAHNTTPGSGASKACRVTPRLYTAAHDWLTHGTTWPSLQPAELVATLQHRDYLGAWAARVAVADWSGDYSHYPYAALPFRYVLSRAAPSLTWPDTALEFAAQWRDLAGERLSALTVLTLAWRAGVTRPCRMPAACPSRNEVSGRPTTVTPGAAR